MMEPMRENPLTCGAINKRTDYLISASNLIDLGQSNIGDPDSKPQFEIIKPIGKGQFSDVYKAKWLNAPPCYATPSLQLRPSGPSSPKCQKPLASDSKQSSREEIVYAVEDKANNQKARRSCGGNNHLETSKRIKKNVGNFTNVALKRVKLFDMLDAKARGDCLKEINLLQQLDHPNIIRYSLSFIDKNDLFIVLELADGGDLSKLIRHFLNQRQLLTERTILKYFTQVCSAVRYIHSKRVLHRDIKPANIFMTSSGCVKLGDFGLGRYFSPQTMDAHSLVGTFYYMAPERIRQSGYSFSSDVWSIGCVLYELMALRPPFCAELVIPGHMQLLASPHRAEANCSGDVINLKGLIDRIDRGDYQPVVGDFSQELKELVKCCLNTQPELRIDMEQICLVVDGLYEEKSARSQEQNQLRLSNKVIIRSRSNTTPASGGGGGN